MKFILNAMEDKVIEIYGDGSQTRTFCFIDNNLEATIASMEDGIWINEVVNIGNDIEITILELAETIISMLNSKSQIKFIKPLKEGDMTRRKPDISKMRKVITGDLISLKKGIELTQKELNKTLNNNLL